MTSLGFRSVFDHNIAQQFRQAVKIMTAEPSKLVFFTKALLHQEKAARKRKSLLKTGTEVPPLLIISITSVCNLSCAGCYSKHLHRNTKAEMTTEKFRSILEEASELGVSIILLAGGEPLVRRDLLEMAADFPHIMFPIFTNATLLDDEYLEFFRRHPHLIPVISLEGTDQETDERRGEGIYHHFLQVKAELKKRNIFWGISLTATRENFPLITSCDYLIPMMQKGCRLFFYVEFVPIQANSSHCVLLPEQKMQLQPLVNELMATQPALFVAFPGDEEQYGGCLAAGRGFLHINPEGKAEPCPFAPYSDTDLRFSTLKDALKSNFLHQIREHHHLLRETEGGCALWANREWVEQIHKQETP